MKRVTNIVNIVLILFIIAIGVYQLMSAGNMDDTTWVFKITGAVMLLVLALIEIVVGILFPKEERYVSKKTGKILKIVLLLNILLNHTANAASYDLANGERRYYRSWEPLLPVIWMPFQALFTIFGMTGENEIYFFSCIIAGILIFLLFCSSVIWRMSYNKEKYGQYRLGSVLLPILVVIIIFGIGVVWALYQSSKEEKRSVASHDEIQQEINQALDSMNQVTPSDSDYMSMSQLLAEIKSNFPGETIYYRVTGFGSDETDSAGNIYKDMKFVLCTDSRDEVYVYEYYKYEEGYVLYTAWISRAMDKDTIIKSKDGEL